jgi:hypothetical protein
MHLKQSEVFDSPSRRPFQTTRCTQVFKPFLFCLSESNRTHTESLHSYTSMLSVRCTACIPSHRCVYFFKETSTQNANIRNAHYDARMCMRRISFLSRSHSMAHKSAQESAAQKNMLTHYTHLTTRIHIHNITRTHTHLYKSTRLHTTVECTHIHINTTQHNTPTAPISLHNARFKPSHVQAH